MATMRIERGAHGEEAVPSNVYYGARTQHAIERFKETGRSYKFDLLASLATLMKCAARMETDAGRLDRRLGALIERAAQEIVSGRWHEQFVFEPSRCGSGELLTWNMNEVLANRALELYGEERGNYAVLSPEWHADNPLYPNRYFTAAFQLAALAYLDAVVSYLNTLPSEIGSGILPDLHGLKDRLLILNADHFDADFAAKLAEFSGHPIRSGTVAHQTFETSYEKISSTMKHCMTKLEPALSRLDSAEMKASFIQISAFHDMIAFMTRSGFSAQGMEEVAAHYGWSCLDLFDRALRQISRV